MLKTKELLTDLQRASQHLKQTVVTQGNYKSAKFDYLTIVNNLLNDNVDMVVEILSKISEINSVIDQDNIINSRIVSYETIIPFNKNFDYISIILFAKDVLTKYSTGVYDITAQIDSDRKQYQRITFNTEDDKTDLISGFMSQVEYTPFSDEEKDDYNYAVNNLHMKDREEKSAIKEAVGVVLGLLESIIPEKFTFEDREKYRLNISVIDNILTEINFMLVFKTVKCMTIYRYIYFIHKALVGEKQLESAGFTSSGFFKPYENISTVDANKMPIFNIFANYDEADIKNPDMIGKFFEDMFALMKEAKIKGLPDCESELYAKHDDPVTKDINELDIVKFIHRNRYGISNKNDIELFEDSVYKLMYQLQTFLSSNETTGRNQLLTYIRDYRMGKDKTVSDLQDDLLSTFKICKSVAYEINDFINMLKDAYFRDMNNSCPPRQPNSYLQLQSNYSHIIQMMNQLYEDVMLAFMLKVRYIESRLNDVYSDNTKNVFELLSLDRPIIDIRDTTLNNVILTAVPSTTFVNNLDKIHYEMTYDNMTMALEYSSLMTQELGIDYYDEAVKDILDKIIAFIKSVLDRINRFTTNYSKAAQWVVNNKAELLKYQFTDTDKVSGIHRYQLDSPDNILKGFKMVSSDMNVAEVSKDIEKFKMSLYPSAEVYNLFKDKPKEADTLFYNMIIYKNQTAPQTVTVSGPDLTAMMKTWIADIENYKPYMDKITEYNKSISDSLTSLKGKNLSESFILEADEAPAVAEDNNQNPGSTQSQQSQQPQGQKKEEVKVDSSNSLNEIITAINRAVSNIMNTYNRGVQKVFIDEYNYVKILYTNTIKNSATTGTANNNNTSRV